MRVMGQLKIGDKFKDCDKPRTVRTIEMCKADPAHVHINGECWYYHTPVIEVPRAKK